MARLAKFLRVVKRFRALIIICAVLLFGTVAALLSTRGLVYDSVSCPAEIVYGTELPYKASAFMSGVKYEYRADGDTEWSGDMPTAAGKYYVRAVSKRINGAPSYGKEYPFAILQKAIDISVSGVLVYGDTPSIIAELAEGDTAVCTDFEYTAVSLESSDITPVLKAVTITNAAGEDVTNSYKLNAVKRTVTFAKRDIKISVESATREYDGTPLMLHEWEIADGSLAANDEVVASFSAEVTLPGAVNNAPEIMILHDGETDVTINYNITVDTGLLTVLKRRINVTTEDCSREYDGTPLSHPVFALDAATPLVEGDSALVTESATITEVGSASNKLAFEIVDGDGNIASDYYELSVVYGTLKIVPRPITVKTSDARKTYDGTPLYNEKFEVTGGSLLDGHSVKVSGRVEMTDAGSTDNALQVSVEGDGKDYSSCYAVTYDYGTLTVDKRALTVTAGDCEKVYDGTPLVNMNGNNYTVTAGGSNSGLISGHAISAASFKGSITDKGRAQVNSITSVTVKAGDKDVTNNYEIEKVAGWLTVTPRPITVETLSHTFVYNGYAQFDVSYKVTSELKPVSGHTLKAKDGYTTVTNVSDSGTLNEVEFEVAGTSGDNYVITVNAVGVLTVTAREIAVVAGDCQKVYDGAPLTNTDDTNFIYTDYDYGESGGLVSGHSISVTFAGSLTEVGKEKINEIASVTITAGEKDVTANYDITTVSGWLEVTKRTVYITTDSDTFAYDGDSHYCDTYKVTAPSEADKTGLVLDHALKVKSKTTVTDATEKPIENVLTFTVEDGDGLDNTANYKFEITCGTLTVKKRTVVFTAGSGEKVYDGYPLSSASDIVSEPLIGGYSVGAGGVLNLIYDLIDGHTYTYTYKEQSIIRVSKVTNELDEITIYDGAGKDVTRNYIITKRYGTLEITKREIKVYTPDYEFVYNGGSCTMLVVNFLNGYSLAETDKFRYDQYSQITDVGSTANIVKVSVLHNSLTPDDVTDCYDIVFESYGTLTVKARPITIKPKDKTAEYNGEFIHWYDGYEYTEFNRVDRVGLISGHVIADINVTLSDDPDYPPLDAGEYKHKINSVNIYDKNGKLVTKNYDITYEYSTLTVTPRKITVTTASKSWVYDGEEHSYHAAHADNIVEGQDYDIYYRYGTGVITDVGTVKNEFNSIFIYQYIGGVKTDVTHNYEVEWVFGDLTVTPRPIIVSVKDDLTKVYDGDPLKNTDGDNFTYTPFDKDKEIGLVVGQVITAKFSGEITNVGTGVNEISSVTITAEIDGEEKDVTANYEITKVSGALEVTKRYVKIRTATNSWVYDGEPHYDTDWDYIEAEYLPDDIANDNVLVEGHDLVALSWTKIKEVSEGNPANLVKYKVVGIDGKDETDNYNLEVATGNLRITRRYIMVVPNSHTWVYDGETHYDFGWRYFTRADRPSISDAMFEKYSNTLLDGDEIRYRYYDYDGDGTVRAGDTITNVGRKRNYCSYYVYYANTDVRNYNYYIASYAKDAYLEITPRPIEIVSGSKSWTYDGEMHRHLEFEFAEGSLLPVLDHKITAIDGVAVQNVMRDEDGNVIGTRNLLNLQLSGTDADINNYDIKIVEFGELKILPPTITIHSHGKAALYYDTDLFDKDFDLFASGVDNAILSAVKEAIKVDGWTIIRDAQRDNDGNVIGVPNVLEFDLSAEILKNFDFEYEWGELKIIPRLLPLISESDTFEYDGNSHGKFEAKIRGDLQYLVPGQPVSYVGWNEFTVVGEYDNVFTAIVLDADGVDKTHNYNIQYTYGKITITPRAITVGAVNELQTKVYDGTPIECAEYSLAFGSLADGDSLTPKYNTVKWATTAPVAFGIQSVVLLNEFGENVTDCYEITISGVGSAHVTPRPLTIKTGSGVWTYTGEIHFTDEYSIEEGTLPLWHYVIVKDYTCITEVGTTPNVLGISIMFDDTEWVDVTECFDITQEHGTLEVVAEKKIIYVTLDGDNKEYDGTPLFAPKTYSIVYPNGVDGSGYTFTIEISGSQTNVGSTSVKYGEYSLKDESGNDTTDNYAFNIKVGRLVVTARTVTLATDSDQKKYDGTPLKNEALSVVGGLISGHEVALVTPASITDVGSISNVHTVKIMSGERDVTSNYNVVWNSGTLTVTPRIIYVTTPDNSKTYDGTPLSDTRVTVTGDGFIGGHKLYATAIAAITHVGTVDNEIAYEVRDINGVNKTDNYDIISTCGTLEITKRAVTIETASNTWVYDGTAKFDYGYTVRGGSFANGETLNVTAATEIVNVGTVDNQFITCGILCEDGSAGYLTDYDITFVRGTLTVTQRPIGIIAGSHEKAYDGTPLTPSGSYTFADGFGEFGLVEGHSVEVSFADNSITVPGEVDNVISSVVIKDGDGNDVTGNYYIETYDGKLTVFRRRIKVQAASAEKVYDGTPLTATGFGGFVCVDVDNENYFDLVEGHISYADCDGSRTFVGSSINALATGSVRVYLKQDNMYFAYVTDYYIIEFSDKDGVLTVTGEQLIITTATDEFTYNGDEHFNPTFTVTGLKDGDSIESLGITVTEYVSVKNVLRDDDGNVIGYENVLKFYLTEATKKYDIGIEYGTLTVNPAVIKIITADGKWWYDGEEHSNPSFKAEGELPDDHNIVVDAYATITDPGRVKNSLLLSVIIGRDPSALVTGNFEFEFTYGTLVVEINGEGGGEPFMWVYGEKNGTVYLRQQSHNKYVSGTDWTDSSGVRYGEYIEYGGKSYSVNYLASLLLDAANAAKTTVDIRALSSGLYAVPNYKTLDGNHVQSSDIICEPNDGDITLVDDLYTWSAQYYSYNVRSDGGAKLKAASLPAEYAEIERAYREYVYLNGVGYLAVDDKTREFLNGVIRAQGFDPADPEIINKVASYIQKSAEYSFDYDPIVDVDEDGTVIAFLDKYKQGVCRHYATAATMLFRTLGMPARYVEGIMTSVKAGEWVEVTIGHAWVEVYIDGVGWVSVEVTGNMSGGGNGGGNGEEGGGDGDDKPVISIKPVDVVEEYKGCVVKAINKVEDCDTEAQNVVRLSDLLAMNYTYECRVDGEQYGIGISNSNIVWFTLYDENGVDVTDNYKIEKHEGEIEVVSALITVVFGNHSKQYDGTPLTITELIPGYAYFVKYKPAGVETVTIDYDKYEGITTGSIDGKELAEIFVERGYIHINNDELDAKNYKIVFEDTSLSVEKIKLTVSTPSVVKPYDGKPIEFPATTTSGNLISGHKLVIEYNKFIDITDGTVMNKPKNVRIVDGDGNDVTELYDIEVVYGSVEITG
ncbi:MAG: transglutaminase domain-containing protein [Clostridiales bacterium]|nr:transglutaminase domain-containing protein [Clostridiales bacterium]